MRFEELFIQNCFENVQDMVDFINEYDYGTFLMKEKPLNENMKKKVESEINMFFENIKNMCVEYISAKKIAMHENCMGEVELEENPDIDYSFFKK